MEAEPDLLATVARIEAAPSLDALRGELGGVTRRMGFDHVALVQHGGLPRVIDGALIVTDYPADFVRFYIDGHYYLFDPVYDVSAIRHKPFEWREIFGIVAPDERQAALFDMARDYGLAHGVTVPLHCPGEAVASCPFASSRPVEATPAMLTALRIIGAFAYGAALCLHHPEGSHARTRLTRREAECTALVALGKSDWEIGRILGIDETTAKYYVSSAKRRYGIYKRAELVARALMEGLGLAGESLLALRPKPTSRDRLRRNLDGDHS
ncbi:MAG: LuxR family transcriptional regulator [Sphingobium sp.]